MILIIFPLPPENPFDIKVKIGKSKKLDENVTIAVTGMSEKGAKFLDRYLADHPDVEKVIEFGGAASVKGGRDGEIYEVMSYYSYEGELLDEKKLSSTELPKAAITGGDFLFRREKGVPFDLEIVKTPLLFSMESLFFLDVAKKHEKDFQCFRIVTDDGSGNKVKIMLKYITILKKFKQRSRAVLEEIVV